MLFHSSEFVPFLLATFLVYWALPARGSSRTWVLLAASFYFYASWNHWLALLIGSTSCLDYLVGRGLDASGNARRRKALLVGSLAMNLGLLAYFKYANFFLDSLERRLRRPGLEPSLPTLQRASCRSASRSTRSRRSATRSTCTGGKIPAERSLPHFLLFILFFPHLVAGPIVRGRRLPAADRAGRSGGTGCGCRSGVQLFLLGLFKKMAIADRMALFCRPGVRRPGRSTAPAPCGWRCSPTPSRSTATSPATPTWPSGSAHLLGYKLTQQLQHAVPGGERRASSGGGGTSRCRPGCATTCSSRSAAAAAARWRDVPQPDDHDGARRAVARGELELRRLGRAARPVLVVPPRVPAARRPARSRSARHSRAAWGCWRAGVSRTSRSA